MARALAPYGNVLINVANEHTVGQFAGCPFPMRTREGLVELCRAAKQAAPYLLVGGGGGHPGVNAELVGRPEVDLLFFDWSQPSSEAVAAYRAVDPDKPLMNVEVFGAAAQGFVELGEAGQVYWPGGSSQTPPPLPGRRRVQGVFPPERSEGRHRGKLDFLDEIEFAARTPGFSLFGHFPGWYQGISRAPAFGNRFDLGGDGTLEDPGIRWYFEAVARIMAGAKWRIPQVSATCPARCFRVVPSGARDQWPWPPTVVEGTDASRSLP